MTTDGSTRTVTDRRGSGERVGGDENGGESTAASRRMASRTGADISTSTSRRSTRTVTGRRGSGERVGGDENGGESTAASRRMASRTGADISTSTSRRSTRTVTGRRGSGERVGGDENGGESTAASRRMASRTGANISTSTSRRSTRTVTGRRGSGERVGGDENGGESTAASRRMASRTGADISTSTSRRSTRTVTGRRGSGERVGGDENGGESTAASRRMASRTGANISTSTSRHSTRTVTGRRDSGERVGGDENGGESTAASRRMASRTGANISTSTSRRSTRTVTGRRDSGERVGGDENGGESTATEAESIAREAEPSASGVVDLHPLDERFGVFSSFTAMLTSATMPRAGAAEEVSAAATPAHGHGDDAFFDAFDDDDLDVVEARFRHYDEQERVRLSERQINTATGIGDDINDSSQQERHLYEALDSDGVSENDGANERTDSETEATARREGLSDDELEGFMDEFGVDINDDDALLHLASSRDEIKGWEDDGWEQVPRRFDTQPEYGGLYDGDWGPSSEVDSVLESPLDLFWLIIPKSLFQEIADQSNLYAAQTLLARAKSKRDRQVAKKRRDWSAKDPKSLLSIREDMRRMPAFQPHEYVVLIGLLIARMLCPHKRRLSSHWATTSIGALPFGTFGQYMPRSRFDELMQHLHFSDNRDPAAKTDRAWKIRPLINTLQATFKKAYVPGGVLSFDEGMLPSQSRFNGTRVYMKDKPHKWGTKLFLTCCPRTSYCLRLEVYCGKKAHLSGPQTIDDKSGPAAVLRNVLKVIPENRTEHHLVVMDRFYTSVALAVELLAKKVYSVGTIQPRRIGYPTELKDKRKARPAGISRGSYKVARSRVVPGLVACAWWDSKLVHVLATGASTQELTIERNTWVDGECSTISCPKVMKDYQRDMGGVDVFDQLRLQYYSLQLTFKFKKYYKSLALGCFDLALTNIYILYRAAMERLGKTPMSHVAFLTLLHAQLLHVKAVDMTDTPRRDAPVMIPQATRYNPNTHGHVPTSTEDYQEEPGRRKRMARACKVCSSMAPKGTRGFNSKDYCPKCSEAMHGPVYLCQKQRDTIYFKSCFAIWHEDWGCGRAIPDEYRKRIQFRKPTGKKRQRREASDGCRSQAAETTL